MADLVQQHDIAVGAQRIAVARVGRLQPDVADLGCRRLVAALIGVAGGAGPHRREGDAQFAAGGGGFDHFGEVARDEDVPGGDGGAIGGGLRGIQDRISRRAVLLARRIIVPRAGRVGDREGELPARQRELRQQTGGDFRRRQDHSGHGNAVPRNAWRCPRTRPRLHARPIACAPEKLTPSPCNVTIAKVQSAVSYKAAGSSLLQKVTIN